MITKKKIISDKKNLCDLPNDACLCKNNYDSQVIYVLAETKELHNVCQHCFVVHSDSQMMLGHREY